MHVLHIISSVLSIYYKCHPHISPTLYCPANIRLFFYLQRKFQQNRHHVVPHPPPLPAATPFKGWSRSARRRSPPPPPRRQRRHASPPYPLHCSASDATPSLRLFTGCFCSPPLRTRSVPAPSVHRLFNGFLSEGGRSGDGAQTEGRPGVS